MFPHNPVQSVCLVAARSCDTEEHRDAACHSRDKIHVAKAQLELKLPEIWGTIKSFSKYIHGNSQCKNNISLFQDEDGPLTNRDREQAEAFNAFFTSVFST